MADGDPAPGAARATAVEHGRVGFVFSGNGAQWVGMGAELLGTDDHFTAEVDAVDGVLRPLLGWSVREEMAAPRDPASWQRTEIAQPMLFAVQAGLVAALAARGFAPTAICGHSVGEVAAAYCAGALDRASACQVIAARSRAQGTTAGSGRMAAVGLADEDAGKLIAEAGCTGRLVVAGINSGRDVTVAGDAEALAALGELLDERGVFFRDLGLDYAFHSTAMDELRRPLADALAGLAPQSARIPLVSTVTGRISDGRDLDAAYWWRNVREPVRFADATGVLVDEAGCDVLLELGPHPVLGAYLRRTTANGPRQVAVVPTLTRTGSGPGALDTATVELLACGAETDWDVSFPRPGRVADLPAYPWQRERHWNGSPQWWEEGPHGEEGTSGQQQAAHALLGVRLSGPRPAWQQELLPGAPLWLADHRVGETVVMPAAGYVDMALTCGQAAHDAPAELSRLAIGRALDLPALDTDRTVHVHTALDPDGSFTVSSREPGSETWTEHARGKVRKLLRDRPAAVDLAALRARLPRTIDAADHYALCARAGLPYGPAFRTLTALRTDGSEALAQFTAAIEGTGGHLAHPTVLDGALQAGLPLLADASGEAVAFLPAGIDTVRCWEPLPATGLIHVQLRMRTAREVVWDLTVMADDGTVVLEAHGCRLRRYDASRAPAPQQLTEVQRAAALPASLTASPWPTPAETLAASAPQLAEADRQWRLLPHHRFTAQRLRLTAHMTVAAVRKLIPDAADFTMADLFAAGVEPRHRKLLSHLLADAVRQGILTAVGAGRWYIAEEPQPHRFFREALLENPTEGTTLHAYGVCGLHLADVLRGHTDPLTLLFAEPDALAARFYDSTPTIRHLYKIARHLMTASLAARPDGRPLRVLEVGAGTGGFTSALLACLPPERTQYTYTDVSSAFFPAAQERFAAYDFVDYRCFDLNADPLVQDFTPASYDLVVAANVLHATRNVKDTLHRIGDLLADGGQLLAVEIHNRALLDPIFGLLDSYWSAEDSELRPQGPLLARETWPTVLHECGYTGTIQPGEATEPTYEDHSVILSARLPRPADPLPTPAEPRRVIAHVADGPLAAAAAAALGSKGRPASEDPKHWADLLAHTDEVVLLSGGGDACDAIESAVRDCAALRALATATRHAAEESEVTLWLVVCRADAAPPLAGAALWGAARSLANEQPRLTVRRIALAPGAEHRLAAELAARSTDDEVLLTAEGRFVTRVRPYTPQPLAATGPYTLTLDDPGLRYRLGWRPSRVNEPAEGEIVVMRPRLRPLPGPVTGAARRLDQLGMDSLLAVELTTLLQQRLGCDLSTLELMGAPNLPALAQRVLGRLQTTRR
ncbi:MULTISPECIES: acyltransferase domain-containing protein [unclassified Streptomyces]|uniref:acyltransferase domain-containing protein n=1 Tax=unclassified Streptomyces TaxID=2593676 RepID=UPI002E3006F2|nr:MULTISPECIES: acyltransferase domain-containing protein [unclassified Streptomyces]WUC68506.1 acyltransferase domain-containing protein [Streptomyces sp. NBC_00539]